MTEAPQQNKSRNLKLPDMTDISLFPHRNVSRTKYIGRDLLTKESVLSASAKHKSKDGRCPRGEREQGGDPVSALVPFARSGVKQTNAGPVEESLGAKRAEESEETCWSSSHIFRHFCSSL